ncbi:MAG: M20/M25/M40 family metallo-hydrolase [Dehalococcoidia bacterium]|jgi:acetylornithine deacetylase/succinyl-diaminopimelate desuccinylase-like protein
MSNPTIDWNDVTREATDLLCRYIAIDTSNPPGNERAGAGFLAGVLQADGIASERYASEPERANLAARLHGDGSKRPLVLLNHIDVVPAERDFWQVDPYAGVVKDGVIWGRGALDMKSMSVMELMTLLLLKRQGLRLKRDIVFLACADEEQGGIRGIDWLDANHPELFDAEYVINEGGYGSTETFGVRRPVFSLSVGEKGPLWLRLVAHGAPGHGSVPHADNCLERLVRALYAVQSWRRPVSLLPEVRTSLERLRDAGIFHEEISQAALARQAESNPLLAALLTDTISATEFKAGTKTNVIPSVAEASLDCRLLPGHEPAAFIEQVKAVIGDPQVKIEQMMESHTPISPAETELFRTIETVTRETMPDAVVVPSIATGFTDSRAFRRRDVTAYGFVPCVLEPAELATMHGNDERIPVEKLATGVRMLYEIVRRMCS